MRTIERAERTKAHRVVNGVRDFATVLAKLLVGDDLGARSNLALEPLGEGRLGSNLAGNLEAVDDGLGVVVLRVGLRAKRGRSVQVRRRRGERGRAHEVAEVEGGLDHGIIAGEVETSTGLGTGDVGGLGRR
jgi:hypothetical protein